jgi:hypothetical protein
MLNLNKVSFHEISETLAPQSLKDHPVTWQKFIKGGFQSFEFMVEANAFPMKRREWGMTANISGIFHVISDDLQSWNPAEYGYITFNPVIINQQYNIIYPWNFKITGRSSHEVIEVIPLIDGIANSVQHIYLSGNESSAITYEILKWYP